MKKNRNKSVGSFLREAVEKRLNVIEDLAYLAENRKMLSGVTDGSVITTADIMSKLKEVILLPGLTSEQSKAVRRFYYPYKVSTFTHREMLNATGEFHAEYLPEEMFFAFIDPYLNSHKQAVGLENKCLFDKLFPGIRQPKTVALRMNGIWLSPDWEPITRSALTAELNRHSEVFAKEAYNSCGGHGVFRIRPEIPGETVGEVFARKLPQMNGDLIIQLPVRQHEALAKLNPSSVNCFRVITLLTQEGVKVLSSAQKFGARGAFADNLKSGGFFCGIDSEGKLMRDAYGYNSTKSFQSDPETGLVFEGYEIPSYGKAIEMVKKAHPMLPCFRLISWDMTIDEDGEPVLIEANLTNGSLVMHQQTHGPLFGKDTKKIVREALKGSNCPRYKKDKR